MSFLRKLFGQTSGQTEPGRTADAAQNEPVAGLPEEDQIILCIPGPWPDRSALIRALLTADEDDPDYMPGGMILLDRVNGIGFGFDFQEQDDDMARAFASAARPNMRPDELDAFVAKIATHRSVCYLSTIEEPQSRETALAIARAAAHLVKAGGFGVKVETTGHAFAGEQWKTGGDQVDLHRLFVLDVLADGDATYSCGMRNLGLPDAIVSGEEFQPAVHLLREFNRYQVFEDPELLDGQTFSLDADAPRFRLSLEDVQPYGDVATYVNPFGMWRLSRVTQQ